MTQITTVGLDACDDEEEASGSASESTHAPNTGTDDQPEPDPDASTPAALDHEAALTAGFDQPGFDQQLAITCGYTYDEQELAGLQALNPAAEIDPETTIYLDRGAVYWDIPQPNGGMSHMLALDGFLYTWKVPGDSTGIKSPDATNRGGDELKQRMAKNAHDCAAYDGPASIFQSPAGITFQALG